MCGGKKVARASIAFASPRHRSRTSHSRTWLPKTNTKLSIQMHNLLFLYLSSLCTRKSTGWSSITGSFAKMYIRLLKRYAPQGCTGMEGGLLTAKSESECPTNSIVPAIEGSWRCVRCSIASLFLNRYCSDTIPLLIRTWPFVTALSQYSLGCPPNSRVNTSIISLPIHLPFA